MTWQMWLALALLFVLVIVRVVIQRCERRWRAQHREALEEIERILKEQGRGSPKP
jgi:preprotein translocase subunit YajC